MPPSLSLIGCNIKTAGSELKIRELCENVEELDLASNSFEDLNEIIKIARSMPNLRFLNISENNLSFCKLDNYERPKLSSIKSLVLNNTKVPWAVVQLFLDAMPCIHDLHLSLNNYRYVELNPQHKYYNVKHVYLSGNPELKNWQEIRKLMCSFPSLEGLTMADCNISTIHEELLSHLPKLKSLNISNWPISSWDCMERLNHLPNLRRLRCQGITVLNNIEGTEYKRYHLIARLPNIQRLNGSEISEDERVFAEKQFLRWFIVNEAVEKPQMYVS